MAPYCWPKAKETPAQEPLKTFKELGVRADLIKGILELGIERPTEVQEKTIPVLIEQGKDIIVQAQTGTGKTAAFGLPLLMRVDPSRPVIQGLVIAPTRDLAKQVGKQLFRFTKFSDKVFVEVLAGGDPIERQVSALQRQTHIVVVTPGRLLDLIAKKALSLEFVRYVILDEADEMLSMGFKKELQKILSLVRDRRGTWMFSATIPESILQLAKESMTGKPTVLKVDQSHVVNRDIEHFVAICTRDEKAAFISDFLDDHDDQRGVIFCRTKGGAILLGKLLTAKGHAVTVIQGDLTQKERDAVLRSFKKERFQFLIATDVAARGIDVEGLSFVIHHQLPEQIEYYTHRSGRTARAGRKGKSIALIEPRERPKIKSLESKLSIAFNELS